MQTPMKCHTFHLGLHCLPKYTSPAGNSCVQRVYSKNTYIHIVLKSCRNLKFSLHSQLSYIDTLSKKKISKMEFQFLVFSIFQYEYNRRGTQLKRKASKQINTNSTEPNVKSQLTTHCIPSTSSHINQIPLIGNTGTSSQTAGTSSQTARTSSQTAGNSSQTAASQTAGSSSQTARTSSQTVGTSAQTAGSSSHTAGTSSQTAASQTAGTSLQTARTSSQTAQTSSHS